MIRTHSLARTRAMRSRARRACALLLPIALAVSACALQPGPTSDHAPLALSTRGEAWVRTELYFGLSIPPGADGSPAGRVTDEEWQRFVDEEISPRFPDGLTIQEAGGQWRSRP